MKKSLTHAAESVELGPDPPVAEDAARHLLSRPGREAEQRACGLPPRPVHDWQSAFLDAFAQALKRYRSFRLAMETCTHCGACANTCPFFTGTGDPANMPVARADLAREIYHRHFRPGARGLSRIKGRDEDLSEKTLVLWFTYFHQCSLCRRCALFCPLGIDTSEVTRACREIMAAVGMVTKEASRAGARLFRTGNTLNISPQSWAEMNLAMEAELKAQTGEHIKCPVDEYGAEALFIPPAADLITHKDTYLGYAKAFHAAGLSWTTSTYINDAVNPGFFLNYRNLRLINQRVLEAARELRPKYIFWGESGQGWWVGRNFSDTLFGPWAAEEYLEIKSPVHIMEWTADLLKKGAFQQKIKKQANDDKVVTYHDPCATARSACLLEEPRAVIRACCHHFHEMPASTIRERTLCCGGGGGLGGEELKRLRVAAFLPRARALDQARASHGCNWVAMICDQCRNSFLEGLVHYGLAYRRGGVHELLGNALYPARSETTRRNQA